MNIQTNTSLYPVATETKDEQNPGEAHALENRRRSQETPYQRQRMRLRNTTPKETPGPLAVISNK